MTSFFEANQVRLAIKMKLSNYAWYNDCSVVTDESEYTVLVGVSRIDAKIRKIVPRQIKNVSIKLKVN